MSRIESRKFRDVDINDQFFDTLKNSYQEFETWYQSKHDQDAFVLYENGELQAFLYLKIEDGPLEDTTPILPNKRRVKVGTFKVNPHGTRLGERFLQVVFDFALNNHIDEIYVTVFDEHEGLILLFKKYGFVKEATKTTQNGTENVYIKSLDTVHNDIFLDFPRFQTADVRKFMLGIKPEYHTELFPDSILRGEDLEIVKDVSHTNSIHKIYVCSMQNIDTMQRGDIVIIYRTKDRDPARYRSVATSVCVVEEVKMRQDFSGLEEYLNFCRSYSVFNDDTLTYMFNNFRRPLYIIKFTYNRAFSRRITMGELIDDIGLSRDRYWGFSELSSGETTAILEQGAVDASLIIN